MKKNMLSVLVLIVCIANLTLVGYMVFTIIPNEKRTDELITKIVQIIDLELESPIPQEVQQPYSIDDVEKFSIATKDDKITCNLATGEDGKAHYAQIVTALITINSKDVDYERLNPKVETMKSDILSIFMSNVSKCTFEELSQAETKTEVKKDILNEIQALFDGSKFIVDVTLDWLVQ